VRDQVLHPYKITSKFIILYMVKPLLSDARSSDSCINRPSFNQVGCDRFLPVRVG
jgi:hypothetical protein